MAFGAGGPKRCCSSASDVATRRIAFSPHALLA